MTRKILIVDDERELVEAYVAMLARGGICCLPAFTGEDAMRIFDTQQFDLVLTDLNLPFASGYEVIRHIHEHSPATPIIVMTGYNAPETSLAAERAGALVCLNKPVTIGVLIEQITLALGRGA
jgi:two-component system, NtrC family, response regulator PilR